MVSDDFRWFWLLGRCVFAAQELVMEVKASREFIQAICCAGTAEHVEHVEHVDLR